LIVAGFFSVLCALHVHFLPGALPTNQPDFVFWYTFKAHHSLFSRRPVLKCSLGCDSAKTIELFRIYDEEKLRNCN
jgi:hypothetical protein